MKRALLKSLASSGLILAALMPAISQATDGVIDFTGSITDVTCSVNGQAPGENNITKVEMGRVSPETFKAIGDTSPFKSFQLVLSGAGCTNDTKVAIAYEQFGNVDPVTGNLKLSGTAPASGVQIQIYNDTATPNKIVLGQAEASPQTVEVKDNTATLKYKANYVATSATVSPGSGLSFVRYTLSYK